jgi:ferredoxin
MNVLLLSSDPLALDAVFCRLVHMPAAFVPTMKPGAESGLGTWADGAIEVVGDKVADLACADFKIVRQPAVEFDRSFPYYLKKWLTPRPYIDAALCRDCGVCSAVCPLEPKAVSRPPMTHDAKPVYDYERCIRCYCCQEMCPHGAIAIRRPLLSRIIHR